MTSPSSSAEWLIQECKRTNRRIATAESVTGGLIAAVFTAVPGASQAFVGGACTYTAETKSSVLGVSQAAITNGLVSAEVAHEMAAGAARLFSAELVIATTGAAGPTSHDGAPVGDYYVGLSVSGHTQTKFGQTVGNRKQIRARIMSDALHFAAQTLGMNSN